MANKKSGDNEFTEFHFFGFKNLNPIVCRSEWLVNYLHFLEWDEEVKSYWQPDMYLTGENGKISVGVKIDLWVNLCSGEKHLIHLQNAGGRKNPADDPAIYAYCERFCEKNDLTFQAIDVLLPPEAEPLQSNINILWDYAQSEIHWGHLWLVNKFFKNELAPDTRKLRECLMDHGYEPDMAGTLLFHHCVNADLIHFPLSYETPLTKGDASSVLLKQMKPLYDFSDSSPAGFDSEVF